MCLFCCIYRHKRSRFLASSDPEVTPSKQSYHSTLTLSWPEEGLRAERPQSNLGPGSELSLGSDTPSPWSSSTTQSSSAWSAPPPSTSPRRSSLVWILVYFNRWPNILLAHLISVNSVLMRRSAVTESEKKPENEDSPTLKEDENKDSILEHEYWQDESTKL